MSYKVTTQIERWVNFDRDAQVRNMINEAIVAKTIHYFIKIDLRNGTKIYKKKIGEIIIYYKGKIRKQKEINNIRINFEMDLFDNIEIRKYNYKLTNIRDARKYMDKCIDNGMKKVEKFFRNAKVK